MKSLISMLDMCSTLTFCSKIAQTGKKLLEVARIIKMLLQTPQVAQKWPSAIRTSQPYHWQTTLSVRGYR